MLLALAAWLRPPVVHAPAPAARPDVSELEAWTGDVAGARREAAERNVPLLVHLILEDEEHNDLYRDQLLPNAELLELSRLAVVIVANNGSHPQETVKEKTEDGHVVERVRCSVYPMFERCNGHADVWQELYIELREDDGALRCPQTLIELPGGKVSWHHDVANPPTQAELNGALKRAQKAAGPGLSSDQLRSVKVSVQNARTMTRARAWPDAWRHWQAVLAIAEAGKFAEEARAGSEACLEEIRGEVKAAQALLVPGTAVQGYAKLVELAKACADLPLARDLARAVKEAERIDEIEEEIERYKHEQEALELLREAEAHVDAGDEGKAERAVKKLLRKYADTPAAQQARERWPEWR